MEPFPGAGIPYEEFMSRSAERIETGELEIDEFLTLMMSVERRKVGKFAVKLNATIRGVHTVDSRDNLYDVAFDVYPPNRRKISLDDRFNGNGYWLPRGACKVINDYNVVDTGYFIDFDLAIGDLLRPELHDKTIH